MYLLLLIDDLILSFGFVSKRKKKRETEKCSLPETLLFITSVIFGFPFIPIHLKERSGKQFAEIKWSGSFYSGFYDALVI